jgi:hypothetical protein
MEVTVYLVLVALNILIFYLAWTKNEGDEVSINGILLKLLCGIMFMGVGALSTVTEYYLPNSFSYTPVVNIMESGNQALLIVFVCLGVLHLFYAILDGFEYAFGTRKRIKQEKEEQRRREDYEFDTEY